MARIAIYDPSDTTVANRVIRYLQSANTPDYDGEPNKVVNPDLSALSAVPQKYWKYDSGGPPYLVEMIQAEKDAIDALSPDISVQYVTQQPQNLTYEICDRDILLNTCLLDVAASLTINGADANGDITYTSKKSNAYGNGIQVEHVTGATGGGNENRALAASSSGQTITVTFGTDGSGNSVTPTANAIKTAVDADSGCAALVSVAVGGTGASNNATATVANLTGGTDNSFEDLKIDPATNKEVIWGEMESAGVYKDSGGTMVLCTSQADADTNGILSTWCYKAVDQSDMVTDSKWDLKDGGIGIDSNLPVGEKYDHRIYAMAGHGLGQANHVRFFDGYMGPKAGDEIMALSPTAKLLDPALAPTASELKIWIRHPAGSKLKHVLRLVTYRPKGSF